VLDRADIERIVGLEYRVSSLEDWRLSETRARDDANTDDRFAEILEGIEQALEKRAASAEPAGLGALGRQYIGRPFAFLFFLFLVWLLLREANENFPKLVTALGPIAKVLGL
jgi:hypothetical protein